ncbi:MAG: rRNA adenine N(6)-methyltransferase family protein [Oscillospiraceae bacterium]|nr:rRNA adenine N(6)-methyltransferase family protein [Oscillospiraceae bacterium]
MPRHQKQGRSAPVSVSQNFLTERKTIRRLIRIAGLRKADHVVEIGAGKGHITRELAKTCARVSAYEIDPSLSARLRGMFASADGVRVTRGDFLEKPLPGDGPYKVFSNIPFSRTSEIIRKLTGPGSPPEDIWLVTEKGAALRFQGIPGDTRASLLLKPFYTAEIRYTFRREDFHPAPSVDVVLLHLKPKPEPDLPLSRRREYEAFIAKMLTRRSPRPSGETLYIQWLCLFRRLRGRP